jgi:hypothetical protein
VVARTSILPGVCGLSGAGLFSRRPGFGGRRSAACGIGVPWAGLFGCTEPGPDGRPGLGLCVVGGVGPHDPLDHVGPGPAPAGEHIAEGAVGDACALLQLPVRVAGPHSQLAELTEESRCAVGLRRIGSIGDRIFPGCHSRSPHAGTTYAGEP